MTSWLRSHATGLGVAAAIGLLAASGAWYFERGKSVATYVVKRGDLLQSVVATGRVISPQRISIGATITERVARVNVAEGDTVHREQVLLELDPSDEQAMLAQAQAALAQAGARVRQIATYALPQAEQALVQAQANLVQAQRAWQRSSDLVDKGFVSRSQLDDAQRNLDVAQSQVRTAQLQVASNGAGGSDAEVARMARVEAETQIRVAQAKLESTIIRSPADGVLIARNVEVGDTAQPGKELLVLAAAGETQIVVNVDEKNLGKLELGQRALVSADAYPGQSFPALLFYVNPGVDPVRGAVEIKLRVPQPPAYLRQDMTMSVDIEVGRKNDVLILPSDAIHDATTDRPWVLAVRDGRTERREVILGMRGDAAVEVRDGVAGGEAVVPATIATVTAGQRIHGAATNTATR